MLLISAIDASIAVLFLVLSYIVGSIPFGLVLGKTIDGKDLREYGSKNIGTTNAFRVLGKKLGSFVFLCDVFKGMFVIIIVKILAATGVWHSPLPYILFGLAAILGHSFSIFLDFKGGKIVATSFGVMLILVPTVAILCLIGFLIVFFLTGYVSVGSTVGGILLMVFAWLQYFFGVEYNGFATYFIYKLELMYPIIFTCVACLMFFKHRKNYVRLAHGTENSFKKKKVKSQ